eukprot:5830918-Pleurochrysis_carterae.AAC.1
MHCRSVRPHHPRGATHAAASCARARAHALRAVGGVALTYVLRVQPVVHFHYAPTSVHGLVAGKNCNNKQKRGGRCWQLLAQ